METKLNLKAKKRELIRWSNFVDGNDGDLARHQTFLVALTKQKEAKEVIEKLNERMKQLEQERNEIIALIDKFEGLNHKILKKKYVDNQTLESIAADLGYNYQYIKNKHAELMRIIRFSKKED